MPESKKAAKAVRPRSRKVIENMLKERQQMLVLLWELSKLELRKLEDATRQTLEDFEEVLIDYIAAAHFGLYRRIADGNERRKAVLDIAREIYPRIARSTDIAVEFTEKYGSLDADSTTAKLADDLSLLAEELTSRIELEDRLILAMVGGDFPIPKAPNPA